ncbi:hypothetical protein Tco_0866025, partial [Tanacetum coccineum]
MVKFVFHLLDFSPGTILLYQKFLEFNPGSNLIVRWSFLIVPEFIDCIQKTLLVCLVMDLDFFDDLFYISNLEAGPRNLVIISYLLLLMFSNLSTNLMEFSFYISNPELDGVHPTFSKTLYFVFYVFNAVNREFIQGRSRGEWLVMALFL